MGVGRSQQRKLRNPGISWRQMRDQLLGMPAFQQQLASSYSHTEAVEALALGRRVSHEHHVADLRRRRSMHTYTAG